jgi:hypothetical protein
LIKRTLWWNGYEAEFFADHRGESTLYHYIITHEGMAEILAWGQELSREEAENSAVAVMEGLGLKELRATA